MSKNNKNHQNQKSREAFIHLGMGPRPHGIRGAFSIKLFNSESSTLSKGNKLRLYPRSEQSSLHEDGEDFTVEKVSLGNKAILYLKEVSDRSRSEELVPFDIFIHRDELPELPPDEYYLEDLIGLDVVALEDAQVLGKVLSYFDDGAQLVLVLSIDGQELELPFVDDFFPKLDLAERKVVLRRPEFI